MYSIRITINARPRCRAAFALRVAEAFRSGRHSPDPTSSCTASCTPPGSRERKSPHPIESVKATCCDWTAGLHHFFLQQFSRILFLQRILTRQTFCRADATIPVTDGPFFLTVGNAAMLGKDRGKGARIPKPRVARGDPFCGMEPSNEIDPFHLPASPTPTPIATYPTSVNLAVCAGPFTCGLLAFRTIVRTSCKSSFFAFPAITWRGFHS